MELHKINQWLEKYWDAETTLQEERALKAYFNSDEIHAEHEPFKAMFQYFGEEKELGISLEKALAKLPTNETSIPEKKAGKVIAFRKWGLSIAASLVMIFSAVGVWNYYSGDSQEIYVDTYENPEQALQETLDALAFLSKKMNKGTSSAKTQMDKVTSNDIFK